MPGGARPRRATTSLPALLLGGALLLLAGCGEAPPPSPAAGGATGEREAAAREALEAPGATAPDDFTRYTADVFFETVTYGLGHEGGHAFSHDGTRLLVNSDETGVFNAYALDLATGEVEPLSRSETNAVFGVSWFPHDDRVLLTGDVGGNEQNSVFVVEPDGTLHDLSPPGEFEAAGQQSGLLFEAWQTDGTAFFLTSTERDPQLADLYRYDAATYEREMVFRNTRELPFPTRGFHVSPDGRWLSLDLHHTRYHFDIYLVDLHSPEREPRLVLSHPEREVVHRGMGFTPDGGKLVYGTDEFGEFMEAWTYDLETGETAPLVVAEWDITQTRTDLDYGITHSPDGRYRVDILNADSRNEVTITETATGRELDLSFLPQGMLSRPRFSPEPGRLALQLERDTRPTDLFLVDLEARSARRLTEALNPAIDEAHLVESHVVRFESYDGLEIPGLLYRPHRADADEPVPAMVWVHGGPGAQSRQGYNPVLQFLVNQGYAVYAINNRGSKGYGRSFREADRRRHGEADLGDVVASRGFLESIDWIDPERIGVMGSSFGGYLTLAAMTFEPEVFDVGISIVGYSDVIGNITSGGWRLPRLAAAYDEMGHPEEDAERLRRVSPLYFADRIARPLFVAAGANDVRVPIDQNDRLVAAAREAGVQVEYLVFPDEGHGFRRRANRITAVEAYLDFLDRFLGGG
jgi:dipeptidyl aminopeptidase/acylaminoacyl peptidase